MPIPKLNEAVIFAATAHREQVRKYSGIPYVLHCIEVMETVRSVGGDENMQIAALLHDTVEDTPVTVDYIIGHFGLGVATLVDELTDVFTHEAYPKMNRAERKDAERDRLSRISPHGQTIKLADLLSNTKDIVANDENFARVYLKEKHLLLPCLAKGDFVLRARAETAVRDGCIALGLKVKDL